MRLLTAPFLSTEHFLSHYRDEGPTGSVYLRTRAELTRGEPVLIEVSFPGLPNRALIRGVVSVTSPGQGGWIQFADHDASTRDFLVQIARGEIQITPRVERSFDRFPVSLPVDCRTSGERLVTRTADLGAGGVFIRALAPPLVGSPVQITIGPSTGAPFDEITLEGHVAWISDGETKGFGVRFNEKNKLDHRLLRTTLRHASERAKVEFAN